MRPMTFNQDVKGIRGANGAETRFIAYWLLAHKAQLLAAVDQASHGTGRLQTDVLHAMELQLPPTAEQRAIAGVLGALDDKIEQNRRTAGALERLARAIFRAWFVDFEPVKAKAAGAIAFPSMPQPVFDALPARFVDSEVGPVPEGWEVATLGDIAVQRRDASLRRLTREPPTSGWSTCHDGALRLPNGNTLGRSRVPRLGFVRGRFSSVNFVRTFIK